MKKTGLFQMAGTMKLGLAIVMMPLAFQVQALNFEVSDDVKVDVDTTLTYGRQWRVDDRDRDLIAYSGKEARTIRDDKNRTGDSYLLNGQKKQGGFIDTGGSPGTVAGMPLGDPRSQKDFTGLVTRLNSDDGDRNFDQWDVVSSRYAAVSDLNISYKNVGMFVRAQVFYDEVPFEENNWSDEGLQEELWNGPVGRGTINNYADGEISNKKHFGDDYKETLGFDARFLDAYVYGQFPVGDTTLDLRIGRQVISWGESLMLPGGISFSQNRLDASAATVPGVELKEIFLPTGAVYGQINLTEALTMEAYWQYEFIESSLFPTGSFFNMNDAITSNALFSYMNAQYSEAFGPAYTNGVGYPGYADPDLEIANTSGILAGVGPVGGTNGVMTRTDDVTPDDNDQFGFAFRYLLGEGTEMGLYIVNYHDKLPTLWAANDLGEPHKDGTYDVTAQGDLTKNPVMDHYTVRYMDNIRMYGLTLNTVIGDIQTGIEYTYRANAPVVPGCSREVVAENRCEDQSLYDVWAAGKNSNEDVGLKQLQTQLYYVDSDGDGNADSLDTDGDGATDTDFNGETAGIQYMLLGWPVRAEMHTLNVGFTYIAEPSMFWDNAILVGEIGQFWIGGFENDQLMRSHLGSFTSYGSALTMQFMPEYKNVMEGVDLTIPFFVNYGIAGNQAYFNYNEKSLWASIGLEATYLEHWRFATYYNDFSGPDNLWSDRDNVSVNVKYAF
jgi:hypothetical protein